MRNRTVARRAINQIAGGLAGNIEYFVLDEFCTTDSSPIATPRTAEPGPGTGTVVQVDGTLAITSEELVFTAQGTPVWGDLGIYYGARTRLPGMMLAGTLNLTTWEESGFGWNTAAAVPNLTTAEHSVYGHATDGQVASQALANLRAGLSLSTDYKYAIILRATGAWYYIYDGNDWLLAVVEDAGATATLYPAISVLDGAGDVPTFRVAQLSITSHPRVSDSYSLIPPIADSSNNGLDGTPVRVGLNSSEAHFDGSNSYIQLPIAALTAAGFDGGLGGAVIECQVENGDVWDGGESRTAFIFLNSTDNSLVNVSKTSANRIQWLYRTSSSDVFRQRSSVTETGTMRWGISWSDTNNDSRLRAYFNGVQEGADIAVGGIWGAGVLSRAEIGATSTIWLGLIPNAIFWLGYEPTAANMAAVNTKLAAGTLTTTDLDTITTSGGWVWYQFGEQYSTDGFGHLEANGQGSGHIRNGRTFSSEANKRYNGAVGGANLVTNGDFGAWTADDPDDFTIITAEDANNYVSENPSGKCQIVSDTSNIQGIQQSPVVVGKWYRLSVDLDTVTLGFFRIDNDANLGSGVHLLDESIPGNYASTFRATDTIISAGTRSAVATDVTIDNLSIGETVLADLLDLVDSGVADHYVRADLTIAVDTQGGVGLSYDSETAPQSGIHVYFDRTDNKVKAEKWDSGAFVAEIMSVAATYSAGGTLEARWSDTNSDGTYDLWVTYNGTYIGIATVSDANIVDNTNVGLFGLLEGGYAENENDWNAIDNTFNNILDLTLAPRTCPEVSAFTEGFDEGFD